MSSLLPALFLGQWEGVDRLEPFSECETIPFFSFPIPKALHSFADIHPSYECKMKDWLNFSRRNSFSSDNEPKSISPSSLQISSTASGRTVTKSRMMLFSISSKQGRKLSTIALRQILNIRSCGQYLYGQNISNDMKVYLQLAVLNATYSLFE